MNSLKIKNLLVHICTDSENIRPELIDKVDYPDLQEILTYLDSGGKVSTVASIRKCELCNQDAGFINYHTDAKWIWPIWVKHYLIEHRIKLPTSFLRDVRSNNYSFDEELVFKILNQEIDDVEIVD